MTEETLDKLRTHAARMHDEASRLVRALRGSNANEDQAREHLGNVEAAARKCRLDGLEMPLSVPFVALDPPLVLPQQATSTTLTVTLPAGTTTYPATNLTPAKKVKAKGA